MKITVLLVAAMLLGACSDSKSSYYAGGENRANKLFDSMKASDKNAKSGEELDVVNNSDGSWIVGKATPIVRSKSISPSLKKKISINMNSGISIKKVPGILYSKFGIEVELASDILTKKRSTEQGQTPALPLVGNEGAGKSKEEIMEPIRYSGTVAGLLDLISNAFSISWRYDESADKVVFFKYVARTFSIPIFPGDYSSGLDEASGVNAKVTSSEEVKTIVDGVKSLISSEGKVTVNEISSSITVVDRKTYMDRVDAYLSTVRDRLSSQVLVDIKIYRLSNLTGEHYGFSWDSFFENLSSFKVGYNVLSGGVGTDLGTPANISFTIPDAASGGLSKFSNSGAIVNALSQQGDLSIVTQASMSTLSGRPVPVTSTREIGYLASITKTLADATTGASTVELNPDSVTEGIRLIALPIVMDDGSILMQINFSTSNLIDLSTVSSGDSTIQTPLQSNFSQVQRVRLTSGSTFVIGGFQSKTNRDDRAGVGDANWWFFGGKKENSESKELTIMIVTPTLIRM